MAKQNNYGFSVRKMEIFKRRREIREQGLSSTDIVYKITKLVDPDLSQTTALQEEIKRSKSE